MSRREEEEDRVLHARRAAPVGPVEVLAGGVTIVGVAGLIGPLRCHAELSKVLQDEPERGSGAAQPPLLLRHQGKRRGAGGAAGPP